MAPVVALFRQDSTQIADIEIQTAEGDLCTGVIRWRDGGEVRADLLELEQLVNDQILPLIDDVQARLDGMGLFIVWRDVHVGIRDLQVYEDRDVSFRCDLGVVGDVAQVLGELS